MFDNKRSFPGGGNHTRFLFARAYQSPAFKRPKSTSVHLRANPCLRDSLPVPSRCLLVSMNAPFEGKRKPKESLETLRRANVSGIRKLMSLAGRGPLPGDRLSCKTQPLIVLGGSRVEHCGAQARTGRRAGGARCARHHGCSRAKRTAPRLRGKREPAVGGES